ncbi:hypothetical protein PG999_010524 [Apiospora kogelbergensis]|uniref:Uncharacterized protein n=1 Tax=Apiospora kogelbergensis TaxID=1337665 RepID=A0AAW0QAD1_9PEZI
MQPGTPPHPWNAYRAHWRGMPYRARGSPLIRLALFGAGSYFIAKWVVRGLRSPFAAPRGVVDRWTGPTLVAGMAEYGGGLGSPVPIQVGGVEDPGLVVIIFVSAEQERLVRQDLLGPPESLRGSGVRDAGASYIPELVLLVPRAGVSHTEASSS